jgi:hypothetical protein
VVRAFGKCDEAETTPGCNPEGLLVLFRLLFGRREALKAL